jgi:hypothetical protein
MSVKTAGPRQIALSATVAVVVSLLVSQVAGPARGQAASVSTQQIASSTLDQDLRVTLTAMRGPDDRGAPTATVWLAAYTRSNSSWQSLGRVRVGEPNGWFWFPLTGGHAICGFSASDYPSSSIAVRLRVTPSVGCSDQVFRFRVDQGKLVSE